MTDGTRTLAGVTILLDRDGTVIRDKHYLSDPDGVELEAGAAEGLGRLARAGATLAIVSNQSGVGRGYFDETAMHVVNARMAELLAPHGVAFAGVYCCTHAPEAGCTCRKPATGLFETARAELGFDPALAVVIGDKCADVDLGVNAGARSILVRTGKGQASEATCGGRAWAVVDTLAEAAERLLSSQLPL